MEVTGLTSSEVTKSRAENGSNHITEQETESFWAKFRRNFDDPIIRILCFALIINIIFTLIGQAMWYESVGIAIAVMLATFVSSYSEYKNETAFQKLKEEASMIKCKVWRDGSPAEINIDNIVVGDHVVLQLGDKVPADGVMIAGSIKVDQSILNGEATEAPKVAIEGDKLPIMEKTDFLDENHTFRGTVVCDGNGVMQVTKVGLATVYGKIASELQQNDERDTPLKLKLGHLAGQISKFGYVGGIAIAVAFMFQRIVMENGFEAARIAAYCANWLQVAADFIDAVMLAVVIIVMAVPEGLPLMIAIVSAQNMGKMLKDNVLVRKISGIETAGSLNLLFTDKTGTITKGILEAVAFVNGAGKQVGSFAELSTAEQKIVDMSVRCNTSAMVSGGDVIGGNATERAILSFVGSEPLENIEIKDTVPFSSVNKYSLAEVTGDFEGILVKGAPERIISLCDSYYDEHGQKQKLDPSIINKKIDELASRAIRVLALATATEHFNGELPESGLTLVGVVGIRDEVRRESVEAIKLVHAAGVQVVMITGDRQDTAVAIAKETGLMEKDSDLVLTSDELSNMSDDEIKAKLKDLRVIARALPSDKSRLVRIAQSMNLVVGMTGDGVNDSPALKAADVGFAMGGGTEVAKEVSEIVILDDNFRSIERAILYGRAIFNNIRKFIIFQLTINVGAVLISFVAPLAGVENPLSITQILWVNLIMDTLAALAFGGEPALERYMLEKPKRRDERIINGYMYSAIGVDSLWAFAISMIFIFSNWAAGHFRTGELFPGQYLMTGYFTFFILLAVFNAFNARTETINIFEHIKENPGFLRIMALIVFVQVIMTYFGGVVLRCYGLEVNEWIFVTLLAITIIPIDTIRKFIIGKLN